MVFELTERARIEADKVNKEPQIVLDISGLDEKFGAVTLKKYIRVGDDELYIGDTWRVGGFNEVEDQKPYITFTKGTSTKLTQTIDQDKGETSTITSMSVTVIDKNEEISALLKPDTTQSPTFDLLGRSCKVWFGFAESGWKDDYIIIFRGIIESYSAHGGYVTFNLAAVDKLVDSELFPKVEVELATSCDSSTGYIQLDSGVNIIDDTSSFPLVATGLNTYLQVEDEIIQVDQIFDNGFAQVTRGALGTSAASHAVDSVASTIYEIQGNVIDIVLRLLFSNPEYTNPFGTSSFRVMQSNTYANNIPFNNFRKVSGTEDDADAIVFIGTNVKTEYGVRAGDFISIGGSASGNDVALEEILDVTVTDEGNSVVSVSGQDFTEEVDTSATAGFASQYGVYTAGLKLPHDLVDIDEFIRIRDRHFSATRNSFYIKDTMNVREFIEQKVFKPASLYRVPRNGQFSLAYHFPPLPDEEIKILDSTNVVNPSSIAIRRSVSQNFYNTVVIKYNESPTEDKFEKGYITSNEDSKSRIDVKSKIFEIEGFGLRDDKTVEGSTTDGAQYATTAADRRLKKYAFGAEFIKGLKVNFKTGFNMDIGDIVNVDLADLKITDIKSGTRSGSARLFEIENKTMNLKTGEISLDLVDTNFNLDARYGLMSPASKVKAGISGTQFVIKPSPNQRAQFGVNEFKKWDNKIGASLLVRNDDFSVSGIAALQSVSSNTLTVSTDLGFTPAEDYVVELSPYTNQAALITNLYAFMNQGTTGTMTNGDAYYQQV